MLVFSLQVFANGIQMCKEEEIFDSLASHRNDLRNISKVGAVGWKQSHLLHLFAPILWAVYHLGAVLHSTTIRINSTIPPQKCF